MRYSLGTGTILKVSIVYNHKKPKQYPTLLLTVHIENEMHNTISEIQLKRLNAVGFIISVLIPLEVQPKRICFCHTKKKSSQHVYNTNQTLQEHCYLFECQSRCCSQTTNENVTHALCEYVTNLNTVGLSTVHFKINYLIDRIDNVYLIFCNFVDLYYSQLFYTLHK